MFPLSASGAKPTLWQSISIKKLYRGIKQEIEAENQCSLALKADLNQKEGDAQ
jgi:hypothetical protein